MKLCALFIVQRKAGQRSERECVCVCVPSFTETQLTYSTVLVWGFPGGSDGKESSCRPGDLSSIPGSVRSPGEENGYPRQDSCLENSMDRRAWQATTHGVAKSWTQLSD